MSDTHLLSPAAARRVDQTCDHFEAAWKAGRRPRLDEYLNGVVEPERPALLRQLLLLDWDYRRRAGDDPRPSDYQTHFPGDVTLIEEVGREINESPDSTCVEPAQLHALTNSWTGAAESRPGDDARCQGSGPDRYDLMQEVGHGGIGVVFRGRDRHLGRELAVKVLRENYRDRPDARRRFVEEARVGSRLQHPAIVPVYELGWFDDRRPYFTMKLVQGHTLAVLLQGRADAATDLPRWLGIFEQVCQAIAYAHAQGVIHRDLKPANVMVGAFGEVQVMDWGFAKQTDKEAGKQGDQEKGEASVALSPCQPGATHSGVLMGTPAYMPPEQARGELTLIDPRADVFALGAILCEILTGRPPYVGSIDEICRNAVTGDVGDAHARLDAGGADLELRNLAKQCLTAERAARPADAGVVTRDLTAYLRSAQERLRQAEMERAAADARATEAHAKTKAERRARRLTVALAATAVVIAIGAVVVPTVGLVLLRAEQQQTKAALTTEARRRQQTRQALDMLTGPVIEDWLGKQLVISPEQKNLLEQALAIYTEFAAETSTDEASQAGLASAYHQVGNIQRILGRMPEAEEAYNRGVEIYAQLSAAAPGRPEYRKELVRLRNHRIIVWIATGRGEQAETELRDLVRFGRELVAHSGDPETRSYVAVSLTNLSLLSLKKGKSPDAEALVAEALSIYEEIAEENPKRLAVEYGRARARAIQGGVLADAGRPGDAEQAFRDALKLQKQLAARFPNVSDVRQDLGETYMNLAVLLQLTNRPREAEAAYREALKVRQQLNVDFPALPALRADLAATHAKLGSALHSLDRSKDAEEAYRNAIVLYEKLTAELPKVLDYCLSLARAHNALAGVLIKVNRPKDAEAEMRAAAQLFQSLVTADPAMPDYRHSLAGLLVNLANWHHQRGELSEARRLLEEAMPHHRAAIRVRPRDRNYWNYLCVNRVGLANTFLAENRHAGMAEAARQLAEAAADAQFPVELMRAAAMLAHCATMAEQDTQLPDAQRTEVAQSYAERAMNSLRLAVKHGYTDAARRDFKELVADLEKTQKTP